MSLTHRFRFRGITRGVGCVMRLYRVRSVPLALLGNLSALSFHDKEVSPSNSLSSASSAGVKAACCHWALGCDVLSAVGKGHGEGRPLRPAAPFSIPLIW